MTMIRLLFSARCLWTGEPPCAWTWDGPDSDLEARRHVGELVGGAKHPTVSEGRPA